VRRVPSLTHTPRSTRSTNRIITSSSTATIPVGCSCVCPRASLSPNKSLRVTSPRVGAIGVVTSGISH
jgi:hypothetical protein